MVVDDDYLDPQEVTFRLSSPRDVQSAIDKGNIYGCPLHVSISIEEPALLLRNTQHRQQLLALMAYLCGIEGNQVDHDVFIAATTTLQIGKEWGMPIDDCRSQDLAQLLSCTERGSNVVRLALKFLKVRGDLEPLVTALKGLHRLYSIELFRFRITDFEAGGPDALATAISEHPTLEIAHIDFGMFHGLSWGGKLRMATIILQSETLTDIKFKSLNTNPEIEKEEENLNEIFCEKILQSTCRNLQCLTLEECILSNSLLEAIASAVRSEQTVLREICLHRVLQMPNIDPLLDALEFNTTLKQLTVNFVRQTSFSQDIASSRALTKLKEVLQSRNCTLKFFDIDQYGNREFKNSLPHMDTIQFYAKHNLRYSEERKQLLTDPSYSREDLVEVLDLVDSRTKTSRNMARIARDMTRSGCLYYRSSHVDFSTNDLENISAIYALLHTKPDLWIPSSAE